MTAYDVEVVEVISLSDLLYSSLNAFSVFINGLTSNHDYFDHLYWIKLVEELNQTPYFELKFIDDTGNFYTDVDYGNPVYFFIGNTPIFDKCMIRKLGDESDANGTASGFGWSESRLIDTLVENTASSATTQSGRPQYDTVAVNTIVSEQLAAKPESGVVQFGSGQAVTPIGVRSEGDKQYVFFVGCANAANTDICGKYSSDFSTNYISIGTKGSDKTATLEFAVSGANENVIVSERIADYDLLANVVKVLGYGDGINQIESYADHSTSVRTKLTADLSKTGTTVNVVDTTDFPSSGSLWIGVEKVNYSGKTGTSFTGLTRGIAYRGNPLEKPYAHRVESPVVDAQYTSSSPQSSGGGSSINSNDIKEVLLTNKEIIDQSTLDILAELELMDRKGIKDIAHDYTPPERIKFEVIDPDLSMLSATVGDFVTITDADAELSGSYRIYKKSYINDYGLVTLSFEVSNTTIDLLDQIKSGSDKAQAVSNFMQGSTCIYPIQQYENCDSTHPLIVRYFLPPETVAVNSIKVNFKLKDFRAYETAATVTSASSGNTYSSPGIRLSPSYDITETTTDFTVTVNAVPDFVGTGSFQSTTHLGTFANRNSSTVSRTMSVVVNSSTIYSTTQSLGANTFYSVSYDDSTNRVGQVAEFKVNTGWSNDEIIYAVYTYGTHSHTIPGQTANIVYGIYEESLTSPSVDVSVGVEGSESAVGTYTTDQENLNITAYTPLVPDNWYVVKFTPNKRMRIEANVFFQIFLRARSD